MSSKRCNKNERCVREIPSSQPIHIQMSSGAVVPARGWTLADRTFVAPRAAGEIAETVTFEIYLLATHAVMVRVYHRAERSDGSSLPGRVWMDVTIRCPTVDGAIEVLSGFDWPAPTVDLVREAAGERWEELVRQGVRVRPWKAPPRRVHGTRGAEFTLLAGSTFPA